MKQLPPIDTGATYTERAGKMARKARSAAVKAGEKLFIRARNKMVTAQIDTVNLLRAAGEKFNQASGRNQLLFNLEGLEFCRKEILPLLKSGIGLKEVQACVHIANRLPAPIKTADELGAVKQELQMSLRILGLVDKAHHEGQSLIERNLFCTVTTAARKFELTFEDLEKEKPVEDWDPDAMDEFLETIAPMESIIGKVKEARKAKPF